MARGNYLHDDELSIYHLCDSHMLMLGASPKVSAEVAQIDRCVKCVNNHTHLLVTHCQKWLFICASEPAS